MLTSLAILIDARRSCRPRVQMTCPTENARRSLFLSLLRCPQARMLSLPSHESLLTQVPMLHCEHRPSNLAACSKALTPAGANIRPEIRKDTSCA